VKTIRNLI